MILPHDDLLDKSYLQKTIQCLKENPQACTAFSDIQGFGDKSLIITQNSIKGKRLDRVLEFLYSHYSAVAFRGLVNKKILSNFLILPFNRFSNFGLDTIWNLQMVLQGEIIRIPEVLYQKRYLKTSVHDSWQKWGNEKKTQAWLEHCKDCLKIISKAGFEKDDFEQLIEASKIRLLQKKHSLWYHEVFLNLNKKEQNFLVSDLLEFIKTDSGESQIYPNQPIEKGGSK